MMRKRSRKNELMMRRFAIIFGIVAILSVLAAGTAFVGIYVFKILPIGSAGSMSPPNLSGVVSQSSGTANGTYSGKAEKNRQEIYQGNLILVNNETEYRLDSETHLGSVFDLRSQSYKSQDKNVRLDKNVIQNLNQMMDAFAQNTGKTDVRCTVTRLLQDVTLSACARSVWIRADRITCCSSLFRRFYRLYATVYRVFRKRRNAALPSSVHL